MAQIRKLAVIMFTDIVGFTALMGKDEAHTLDILDKNRKLQRPIIEAFGGSWIKELGDGVMASFNTVSDAVKAAIQIQQDSQAIPELQLTMGIHLGEVVFENEDVFGDGVNIASRIQAFAEPGSIYISESIHNNIANKQGLDTRFIREEKLKNVAMPVRIYEVLSNASSADGTKSEGPSQSLHASRKAQSKEDADEKSIAVLPFINMSNDPEQDYFCDGISEEIIDALAQLDELRVVARTSSFSFKGKNLDVREIGNTLDVGTLLEGSVRKAGKRLRITTKLLSVKDGSYLWNKRYDRELEDIFAIQEDIATNVVTELKGVLTRQDKNRIRPQKTAIKAYEAYLKGQELFHQLNVFESKIMFERAVDIDPNYAPAHAGLANVLCQIYEWHGGDAADLKRAENHSAKALELAPKIAEGHIAHGFVLALQSRFEEAETEYDKAIKLNPNSFDAYYRYARHSFQNGDTEKSAQMFQKAREMRREDFQSPILLAQALMVLKDPTWKEVLHEGLEVVKKHLELSPTDRRALSIGASAMMQTGNHEQAQKWMNLALTLYPEDGGIVFNGACMYALLGNAEKALDLLEFAIEKGYGNKDWLDQDPDYDSLREEPRFLAMMEKLDQRKSES